MKFSIAIVFAIVASLVSSQSVSSLVAQLPSCAISCLATASSSVGCGISDYTCQCGLNKDAVTSAATFCVVSSCSSTDALKTNSITGDICKAATQIQTSATHGASDVVGSIFAIVNHPSTSTAPASAPTTVATSVKGITASAASNAPAAVTGAALRVHGGALAAAAAMLAALAL
ncbi:hypothetical protein MBM_06531 [Drepanopeziza brunnea f. sp. 'multigermtubi' MB_m1]|uniref:CFEM domain-containing protein n=1 Tax=Marssonina brunnea f. sp. multigermtubi (strain MB_m1) TaxID=1072389 RepID=K1WD42_MARBU|nr:uncharacterized protein MBM_06531 [Drepanopeziza brunnea f. sp. 'multigermtubi' MB_m1]EKD15315.1 hypothetical protein MBM_06531 [Drepanopeziza brunnea f. sp. 'multigermtubi' MB_m1]